MAYSSVVPRRRVMQLVLSLSPGGTERLVIDLCTRLQSRVDSVVCCLDQKGAWAAELESAGIPVYALGREPGFQPALALQIARLLKTHAIDAIHCHHYSPYVYGLLAAMLARVDVVFTEHGRLSDAAPSRKRQLVNPLLSRVGGRICAVSAALKEHMVAEGFPADRIAVVYNGIEPGVRPTLEDRRLARQQLGLADDAFVVFTAGRLDPVKDLGTLVDAHSQLLRRYPTARTVIVGDGEERARLLARAETLGVLDTVRFTGYRSDVRALMAAADVYVNCSTYEGVSLTILEAMAAGLPVVATPVGGTPEVVVDEETGVLVSGGAAAIAGELSRLAWEPDTAAAMGDAGRRRVERRFSLTRMVDEYAAAYRCNHSLRPPAPIAAPEMAHSTSVTDATRFTV